MKSALLVALMMMMTMLTLTAEAKRHKLNFAEPIELERVQFKTKSAPIWVSLFKGVPLEQKLISKR